MLTVFFFFILVTLFSLTLAGALCSRENCAASFSDSTISSGWCHIHKAQNWLHMWLNLAVSLFVSAFFRFVFVREKRKKKSSLLMEPVTFLFHLFFFFVFSSVINTCRMCLKLPTRPPSSLFQLCGCVLSCASHQMHNARAFFGGPWLAYADVYMYV